MKVKFSKRLGAYLIDMALIMLVINFISPIVPKNGDVNKMSNEFNQIVDEFKDTYQKYSDKKISEEEYNTYLEDISVNVTNLSYRLTRANYLVSIVSIMLYLGYFVVLPLFLKGQTLGKKLMKIKIVNDDNSEVNANSLLLRALLLYGIAGSIMNLILLLTLGQTPYLNISNNINTIFGLANVVSLFMIIIRKDKKGLHDFIGRTKVISTEESEA